jgi:pimeloyl-ACP methyl ester carboxylesterase
MNNLIQNKRHRPIMAMKTVRFLLSFLLMGIAFSSTAQFVLPTIPSNSELSEKFELNTEFAFQVKLDQTFLTEGVVVAYIKDEIRGAQATPVQFPATGQKVYKIRISNNNASGDTILFKFYDTTAKKIFNVENDMVFVPNQVPDYAHPTILTAYCNAVEKVTGMIPEDKQENLNTDVDLYWKPSANISSYQLYLWEEGQAIPSSPYLSDLTATTTQIKNLKYGQTYLWKVISANDCSSVESDVQSFKTKVLNDLTITDIQAPTEIISDSKTNITLTIKNIGNWNTGSAKWNDALYLSKDQVLSNDDKLLIEDANIQPLASNGSYTQTFSISLPLETTGDYYVVAKTDNRNELGEISEDNNILVSSLVHVTLKSLPDVLVKDISFDKATIAPGNSFVVNWKVANIGSATATCGWIERISLVASSDSKVFLSSAEYKNQLSNGAIVERSQTILLPESITLSGDVNIEIELIPNDGIQEYPADNANNKALSLNKLKIVKALYLALQSSKLPENSTVPVRCILSRSGDNSVDLVVPITASIAGAVTIPGSVSIPAGSSGATFNIYPVNNFVLNADSVVTISASVTGFETASAKLVIEDDELPSLKMTSSKAQFVEGESFVLTIERENSNPSPLTVYLTTNEIKRFDLPSKVEIPAGAKKIDVNVIALNDNSPALATDVTFKACATRYKNADCSVVLNDDDMPDISLTLVPESVNESAGPQGVIGVIKRSGNTDSSISIKLSSDSEGSVFFPSELIALGSGVSQKQFAIGIVDNALVDGNKEVTIKAAVYLSSCSCSASTSGNGFVQTKLTILDDDGPSLKLVADQPTLLEGDNSSSTITVSRNTSTTNPLTVTLSSKDATALNFPTSVIIPAGKSSVDVSVSAKANSTTEGDRTITIEASADGFTKGICWMMITDQNLPDGIVSKLTISNAEIAASGRIDVSAVITNKGLADLPVKTKVTLYLSKSATITSSSTKTYLSTLYTQTDMKPGESETVFRTITLPDVTGDYYIIGVINETQSVKELSYLNNASDAVSIKLLPQYEVSASVDKGSYKEGENVIISGVARKNGTPAANVSVEVYLINEGVRQAFSATTDQDGKYTYTFTPTEKQMGHFIVGACYPNEGLKDQEAAFDVLGIKRTSTDWITWDLVANEEFTGKIEISNPCQVPLSNIQAKVTNLPDGCTVVFDPISAVASNGKATINYKVIAQTVSTGTDYQKLQLEITSNEGASLNTLVFYFCESQKAKLDASITSINTSMTKGASRDYQFTITNVGKGETGEITLSFPPKEWLSLMSPASISSLQKEESSTIILRLTPTSDMQLNVPVSGKIAINCKNGEGLQLPFEIEPVSESTGTLVVDVCDEYTYYTEAAPHVSGASVIIKHPVTKAIIAQSTTDASGLFKVQNLPEGYYAIEVTAANHDKYSNNLLVDPGRQTKEVVNLSFQAITYTWDVTETEVQDEYTVETTVDYKTNVPVPVVEIKYPEKIEYKNYVFNLILTNKGLITAQNVSIDIPKAEGMTFEILSENPVAQLLPQQSIIVPVRVTVDEENDDLVSDEGTVSGATLSSQIQSGSGASTLKSAKLTAETPAKCTYIHIKTFWYWYCSGEMKYIGEDKTFKIGECPKIVSGSGSGSGSGSKNGYPTKTIGQSGDYTYNINENVIIREKNCEKDSSYFHLNFRSAKGYFDDLKAKVKGLVADGASSIYIEAVKIPEKASSYSFEINSEYKGDSKVSGYLNKNAGNISDLTNYSLIYYAPSEYPVEASEEYQVLGILRLYDTGGVEIASVDTTISIIRPPVLFVHGLNDSDTCFYKFNCYLKKTNTYYDFQIKRADYEESNNDFFYNNRNVVSSNLQDFFFKLLKHGYVGTKADIIGHSMGGILARLHVQYIFNKDVHKLITLNTPHSGSQGANLIMENSLAGNVIGAISEHIFKKYDAINDLQVGSQAVEMYLNDSIAMVKMKNIPIYSLTTTANMVKEDLDFISKPLSLILTIAGRFDKRAELAGKFADITFASIPFIVNPLANKLFQEESDFVVSLPSQQGGLAESLNSENINGTLSNAFHCVSPSNDSVESKLFHLLLEPASSLMFCRTGFKPEKLTYISPFKVKESQTLKSTSLLANIESFTKIENVSIDSLNNLSISMNYSDDTYFASLLGVMSDQQVFSGYKKNETFTIPASYKGDIKIYAIAQTNSGAIVKDSTVFTVANYKAKPEKIQFEEDNYEVLVDSKFTPRVLCTWDNGDETYVEATLSTDASCATVDRQTVKAVKEGKSKITATFNGKTCEVPLVIFSNNLDDLADDEDTDQNKGTGVCSSISLKFTQTITTARQAFRGTLTVFNGNQTTAMKDVKLKLIIKDEDGNVATEQQFYVKNESLEVFGGELDSTWTLEAQKTGKATVLFVPSKLAAPTVPIKYSFGGTLSYLDPFTGTTVTRDLYPVVLTVNPSPDLTLDYFVQRDVLGDDALTKDVIEPSVPAEFSLLINNVGYGDAKKVNIATNQPEIVDNKKGLLIDFKMVGSRLNGKEKTSGFSNINFGSIPAHSTAYVQWYFESSLLGHFVKYNSSLTKGSNYGSEEFNIISKVSVHELIHTISVNDRTSAGFLINEIPDTEITPDYLYVTDGSNFDVVKAASSEIEGALSGANPEIKLTVTPTLKGWNYLKIDDPGNGKYKIVSVIRNDGVTIPLNNVWQTSVTLKDVGDPVHENKIHLADDFTTTDAQTYTIRFELKDTDVLEVLRFENIPDDYTTNPVTSVNVVFNKPIDASTFDFNDISLKVQGEEKNDASIVVSKVDDVTYKIDFTSKSAFNGYYILAVQTSGISDADGINGFVGKSEDWTQFLDVPAITEFSGVPEKVTSTLFNSILVKFNMPIDPTTLTSDRLTLKKGETVASGTITVTPMDTEGKLFQLSGFKTIASLDGNYSLSVDLSKIKSKEGKSGLLDQSVKWSFDQTAPSIKSIIPSNEQGNDAQHLAAFTIAFSEPITGTGTSNIELWKDNQKQTLPQLTITSLSDTVFSLSNFGMITYPEGNYILKVKMKEIYDRAGNMSSDTVLYSWLVDRTAPQAVTGMHITPDMGYSAADNITATQKLSVEMNVNEPDTRIQLYLSTPSEEILLADSSNVRAGVMELPLELANFGNLTLMAKGIDKYNNSVSTKLPVYIDKTALTATWQNTFESPLAEQPSSIQIVFSDKLLDDSNLLSCLYLERDGHKLDIQKLIITKSSDKTYTITDISKFGKINGTYTLSLDLSQLKKYTSGLSGTSKSKIQWIIENDNTAPIANAGTDQFVDEGTIATLSGCASVDSEGDSIRYSWTAPSEITLNSYTDCNPNFVAPEVTSDSVFLFSLIVNDGSLYSVSDTVKIVVKQVNKAPVASAGTNQTVDEGTLVTLDGSGSTDADNDTLTYNWTAPNGIVLSSISSSQPTFIAPEVRKDTTYSFTLVVNDGVVNSITDSVFVAVRQVNKAPVANAGTDQTANEGVLVYLDASGSTDPDNDKLTFKWTAPSGVTLSSLTAINPTFTAPEVSVNTQYSFNLIVNDGNVNSLADQVIITVKQVNKAPVANAGTNQTVAEGTLVTLDGRGSTDADNDALTYRWTTPNGIMLSSISSSRPTFIAPEVRKDTIYTFSLIVNDGSENSQASQVLISVLQVNKAPIANAVTDHAVLEGKLAILDGSESYDPDGDKITYQWTAPAGVVISSLTDISPTFTAPEVNKDTLYSFSLKVSDGKMESFVDEVKILVKQENKVPIANAGNDQSVNEGTLVTLNGNGSVDPDGDTLTFYWKISIGVQLSSNSAINPTFIAPEVTHDTVYAFVLTVSDGISNSQFDQVNIMIRQVNKAPIANAGLDQAVNENTQVILDGAGSSDPDNDVLNYKWTAPAEITLSSNTAINPTFTAPEVTTDTVYTFSLVVNDGTDNSLTDTIIVTVKQVNKAPIANAGSGQVVNENTLVTLDGSASSDPDNDILSYLWTAPLEITLNNTTIARPTFTAPEVKKDTTYVFSLVVNDDMGNSLADKVSVTVKQVNKLPVANAGIDQTVDEGTRVVLDGSASTDADGDSLNYRWITLEGITLDFLENIRSTFTTPEVSKDTKFDFGLIVNDGTVDSPIDWVTIVVKQVNKAPVANAGTNQTVNENAKVILDGSGSSDPDNDALTYKWTAPAGIILNSITDTKPTFTTPKVTNDTILIFSLIVNDGSLDSKKDNVTISVKKELENDITMIDESTIKLFPNPTTNKLNIEIPDLVHPIRVEFFSINGKKLNSYMISNSKSSIDLSSFRSGIYFLKATNLEISYFFKIIKID